MLIEASRGLVLVLGLLVCVMSLFGLGATERPLDLVRRVLTRPWGMLFAVGVRLALGAALIFAAPASRFPLVFEILGWITLAAAVALPLFGRERIRALIDWIAEKPRALVRVGLVLGAVFGAFLVYGLG